MRVPMLTTIDNPYNPFVQFDEWYAWDVQHGYNTCSYLARVGNPPDGITDEQMNLIIIAAIDEIIKFNLSGKYKAIYKDEPFIPPTQSA